MNLLIIEELGVEPGSRVKISGEAAAPLLDNAAIGPGAQILVGEYGGRKGSAVVRAIDGGTLELEIGELQTAAPLPPTDLIVAVPRPQMLKRILQTVAAFGLRRLFLVGSARSQKSYLQTHVLQPEELKRQLVLGLEQGAQTIPPQVQIAKNLFEVLHLLGAEEGLRLVAHPTTEGGLAKICRAPLISAPVLLAIGPEAGWAEEELTAFLKSGFRKFGLGHSILRVETAVTAALAQVALLRELGS